MLISASKTEIEFKCPGCGTVDVYKTKELVLGNDRDPNMMRLGACSGCAANGKSTVHHLSRTWDEIHPRFHGKPADVQRRTVNALAKHLHAKGQSHVRWAEHHASLKDPPDMGTLSSKKGSQP